MKNKITTKEIKICLLTYFACKRNMFVVTEGQVTYGYADILALSKDKKTSYEIEIKTSLADFKADFRNKKAKHNSYNYSRQAANRIYFCVPEDLQNKVESLLPEKYGLMIIKNKKEGWPVIDWDRIVIVKRAKKINNKDNEILFRNILNRLMTENIKLHVDKYQK